MAAYTLPEEPVRVQDVRLFSADERSVQPSATQLTLSSEQKKQEFNILEKLKQLRDEKKYCDITLDVKGNKLEAHKNVLAAWSPYFASKLFQDDPVVYKDTVVVNYDNSEVFADLLDFMYNGYVAPRETNFLQLLHLAVSFQIEMLKNYCEEFLRCNLHLGNFMSTYFLSRKYRLDGLEEFIVGFLQMNLSDAVKQTEFLSLTAAKFNTFLSKGWMEQIKPEIKLFLIISWVGYDVQDRERFLVLLLGHIDWSTVASDFLLEISRTENFFTSHESSLYLLLQTLFSAGIPLGPYSEVFPTLRQTHSHILTQVVHTSVLPTEVDDYYQVTISVMARPQKRSVNCCTTSSNFASVTDIGVNTDVNNQHFKEHELASAAEESKTNADTETTPTEPEQITPDGTERKSRRRSGRTKKSPLVSPQGESIEPTVEPEKETPRRTRSKRNVDSVPSIGDEKPQVPEAATNLNAKAEMVKSEMMPALYPGEGEQEGDNMFIITEEEQQNQEEEEDLDEEDEEEEEDESKSGQSLKPDTSFDEKNSVESRKKTITKLQDAVKPKKKKRGSKNKVSCDHKDCTYSTYIPSRLEKHIIKMHQSRARLTCNICNYDTQVTRQFHKHMTTHFAGPPFSCDEAGCHFSCDRIIKLVRHRLSHSGERPYGCEQCGMRFRSANNLWAHSRIHLGERPFECEVCQKTFALKNTLSQHMVTHSNHRPYLCDTCGFATKYQSHLIAHKRIHTGEVFHCQFPKCTYSTPKRSQLKSHMRSHLGIRSHVCNTCGKTFIERSHLIRHEKLHNEVRPYKCDTCEYSTTRHDKLKEHVTRHHGETPVGKKPRGSYKRRKSGGQSSQIDITAPMLVKWDHGSYSLQQPNSGGGIAVVGEQFGVLRDQLTTSEGLDVGTEGMAMDHRVMSLPDPQLHVNQGTRMADVPAGMVGDIDHTGDHSVLQQVHTPTMNIVSSPQQLHGDVPNQVVSTTTDSVTGETHTYTIIPQSIPVSASNPPQSSQAEYGGLSAFMALF